VAIFGHGADLDDAAAQIAFSSFKPPVGLKGRLAGRSTLSSPDMPASRQCS
jgi:hypothetical protein